MKFKYLNKAIKNKNNSKSLFFYTSKINKEYILRKKNIINWNFGKLYYLTVKIHDYESSLIRRLSGLLYISDVDSGNAKKRALNKNGLKNDLCSRWKMYKM